MSVVEILHSEFFVLKIVSFNRLYVIGLLDPVSQVTIFYLFLSVFFYNIPTSLLYFH